MFGTDRVLCQGKLLLLLFILWPRDPAMGDGLEENKEGRALKILGRRGGVAHGWLLALEHQGPKVLHITQSK